MYLSLSAWAIYLDNAHTHLYTSHHTQLNSHEISTFVSEMLDEKRKDHLVFSVRGQKIETTLKTLSIYPDSKLYALAKYLLKSVDHPTVHHERRATAPPSLHIHTGITKVEEPKPSMHPARSPSFLTVIPATPVKAHIEPPTPSKAVTLVPSTPKPWPAPPVSTPLKHAEMTEKHEQHPPTPHPDPHKAPTTEEHYHEAAPPGPVDGDFEQDNYGVTLVHEHREIHNHFPLSKQDYSFETHSYALVGEPQVAGTPVPTTHTHCAQPPATPVPHSATHGTCATVPPPKPVEKPAPPKDFATLYPNGYALDRDPQTFLKLLHYHDVVAACGKVHYDPFVALEARYWEVDYPHETKEGVYLCLITAQREEGALRSSFARYLRLSNYIEAPLQWKHLTRLVDYEIMGLVRKILDEHPDKWRLCGFAGSVIEDGDEIRGAVLLEHR